jgi:hypothetical protein
MSDFLINAGLFYAIVLAVLVYMLVDARIKLGSFEQAINHYRNTENGSIFGIILAAVVFPIVVAGLLTLAYWGIGKASADEVRWFEKTVIYAGVEHSQKLSPACYEGGVNDRLSSNLGVRQYIFGYKDVNLLAQYHHMSCATNRDREGTDAVGFTAEWVFWR